MIYYICIITPSNVNSHPNVISEHCRNAIAHHSFHTGQVPDLVNEPLVFLVVTNLAGFKKVEFTQKDCIRLCIKSCRVSNPTSYINMEMVDLISEVYTYLKELKLNIDPNVVYV